MIRRPIDAGEDTTQNQSQNQGKMSISANVESVDFVKGVAQSQEGGINISANIESAALGKTIPQNQGGEPRLSANVKSVNKSSDTSK